MHKREERHYPGKAVSPGISIGPVLFKIRGFCAPEVFSIDPEEVEHEVRRFQDALELTARQISELRERIATLSGEKEGQIFDAHLLVLQDREVIDRVTKGIRERLQNADYVFFAVMQSYLEAMRRIPDAYLRERTADIEDVCVRLLRNFDVETEDAEDVGEEGEPHIIVAYDLTPSDTAAMDTDKVMGFVTELGSGNSHTAILARSLGIPAVVGISDAVFEAHALEMAIVDGYRGELILSPTQETISRYEAIRENKKAAYKLLESQKEGPVQTQDGHVVKLAANIELVQEVESIAEVGAQGVGLFRTEFVLLNGGKLPDEEAQYRSYAKLVQGCAPNRVIFRTLDVGGDKVLTENAHAEPNPFLGWRGVRISLDCPEMFRQQLKAILRAGQYGPIGVMFPMISGIEQVREVRGILDECRRELEEAGVEFGKDVEVGIMIEVPAVVMVADLIAREVDFFSIGTNDLTQYSIAVDRVNPHVAKLFESTHPGVIRLLDTTLQAGTKGGIWTGVCGEMASDLELVPLLVGLGVDELSVGVHQVPLVRQAIRKLKHVDCVELASQALGMATSAEIRAACSKLANESYPELFD